MELSEKVLSFPDDYEGQVIATLISGKTSGKSRGAVLYLHGYVDYFFQTHMAEIFVNAGYNFYALDLRKYGRSYLPHQHFNYCRSMLEYYPEIDRAIDIIREDGDTRIVLMGHSTGGLLASLYCAEDGQGGENRKFVSKVILNSPFLEFNAPWIKRGILIPLLSGLSRLVLYGSTKNELSVFYPESIHVSMRGEWNYDLNYKPVDGVPLYFAWLKAIRDGHRRVKAGLNIAAPVLVMHSDASAWNKSWHEIFTRTDAVLNVEHIKRYGRELGGQVTLAEIQGGLHDLVLSAKPVREKVFALMLDWLAE